MNVLILSKEMPVMRFLQNVVKKAAEPSEEIRFFLEWRPETLSKYHESDGIDLLLFDAQDMESLDVNAISTFQMHHRNMEMVFLFEKATVELLQEILSLSCKNYVERPLREEKVSQILSDVIGQLRYKARFKELEEKNHFWTVHEKIIKQQFWTRFINGKISLNPTDILQEAETCGVSILLSDTFHLALLSRQLVKPRNHQKELDTRQVLIKTVDDWMSKRNLEYFLLEQLRPFLIVKNITDSEFLDILKEIVLIMQQEHGIPLCCYYDVNTYCENLFSCANTIIAAEKEDVAEEPGIYYTVQNRENLSKNEPIIPAHAKEVLQNGQLIQFQQIIRSMLLEEYHRGKVSGKYLKMLKCDVVQMIYAYLYEQSVPAHLSMIPEEMKDIEDNAHISIESFCSWMETLCQLLPSAEPQITAIETVKRWVMEHIKDNITREVIAARFYFNPDYLGKLFKKETGETLGNYITTEKIKEAKRMLVFTEKSIGEIGQELGYDNFSFFSKTFVKFVGSTPREYRNMHIGEKSSGKEA